MKNRFRNLIDRCSEMLERISPAIDDRFEKGRKNRDAAIKRFVGAYPFSDTIKR